MYTINILKSNESEGLIMTTCKHDLRIDAYTAKGSRLAIVHKSIDNLEFFQACPAFECLLCAERVCQHGLTQENLIEAK